MVRPAAVILPCSSVLHDALQVQYGHGQESQPTATDSTCTGTAAISYGLKIDLREKLQIYIKHYNA